MSKKEQVVLSINNNNISNTKAETENYLILLSRAKDLLNELTEGNVEDLSIEAVDAYLNNKSGFKNSLMSATAYNLENQYNSLKSLLNDLNKGTQYLQFITNGKVNDAKIKEANTTYLNEDYVDEFLRLQEAVDVLNQTSMFTLRTAINMKGSEVTFSPQAFQV